jgi:hypothetical protein
VSRVSALFRAGFSDKLIAVVGNNSNEQIRSNESNRSVVDGFDDAASYVQELVIKRGKTALPYDPVKRCGIGQHL